MTRAAPRGVTRRRSPQATTQRARPQPRERSKREQGVALIVVMLSVIFLGVLIGDFHMSTSTAFVAAVARRDELRAEYLAWSSIDMTRLLVMREPQIRTTVAPLYQVLIGRPAPQIPIWTYADAILVPFCRYDESRAGLEGAGIDVASVEGLGETHGSCEISAIAENAKINVNQPLLFASDQARKSLALQVFALLGGYESPSRYDPLFQQRDPDGQFTTRLDVVTSLIDWWDADGDRTTFDPGSGNVSVSGGEDDPYALLRDPYHVKNAPFDSLEEIRLIRGVGDDFWASFVQPDPDDPTKDRVTVYGSGAVNPNEAQPEVLLARVCSIITGQPLCSDPLEGLKFVQLLGTIRGIAPVPWFTSPRDFIQFIEGRGGPRDLYPTLVTMLGPQNPLLFRPVSVPDSLRGPLEAALVTAARIITVQSTATSGRASIRIRTVVNTHDRWAPPPPNSGGLPALGVFHYVRID